MMKPSSLPGSKICQPLLMRSLAAALLCLFALLGISGRAGEETTKEEAAEHQDDLAQMKWGEANTRRMMAAAPLSSSDIRIPGDNIEIVSRKEGEPPTEISVKNPFAQSVHLSIENGAAPGIPVGQVNFEFYDELLGQWMRLDYIPGLFQGPKGEDLAGGAVKKIKISDETIRKLMTAITDNTSSGPTQCRVVFRLTRKGRGGDQFLLVGPTFSVNAKKE